MKKRLRKKRHMGEFAVYGVSLRASFVPGLSESGFGTFVDEFIAKAIEANELWFGGGGGRTKGWSGVIDPGNSLKIPATALDAFRNWMSVRREVESFELSAPWDLWYGEDPFDPGPSQVIQPPAIHGSEADQ